jgi:hypothetical protein
MISAPTRIQCLAVLAAAATLLPTHAAAEPVAPDRPRVAFLLSITRLRLPVLQVTSEVTGVLHERLTLAAGGLWGESTDDSTSGFVSGPNGGQVVGGISTQWAGGHAAAHWTLLGTALTGVRAGVLLGGVSAKESNHPIYPTADSTLWYGTATLGGRWTAGPMVVTGHVGFGPGLRTTNLRCCGAAGSERSAWEGTTSGGLDLGVVF